MKSKIAFKNINYRKALLYIATNMNKTDQRTSPLWRILPRRTSRGGVRPGITASPDNEEHWFFPKVELTETEKKMVVATVVKVGVLVMMNRLNSFARLLHFYCCFQKYPYWPPLMPYGHMAIWPYGHILTIWPYSHIDIWRRMASIWVSPESAIKMQQSGEGIMLIRPSCKK